MTTFAGSGSTELESTRSGSTASGSKRATAALVAGVLIALATDAQAAPEAPTTDVGGVETEEPLASESPVAPEPAREEAAPAAPEDAPLPPESTATEAAAEAPAVENPTPSAPLRQPASASEPSRSIVLAPEEPQCEPCEDPNEPRDGSGAFLLGVALFDLSELNDQLQAAGYDEIPTALTLIGGEGRAVFDSGFVAGARGAAFVTPSGDGPNNVRTEFAGGFGMVDLGFALVHQRSTLLTLTAGIGGFGYSLEISGSQDASFDEVLADPQRSASLGRGGVLGALTLGFDGRVPVGPVKRGRRGFFTLGVRVSGLYGPALGGFSLSPGDGDVSSGPDDGLVGGFAALAIGFGGGRQ